MKKTLLDNQRLFEISYNLFKTYKSFFKKLTKDQKRALMMYKKYDYDSINYVLRHKTYPEYYVNNVLDNITEKIRKIQKNKKLISHDWIHKVFIEHVNKPLKTINHIDDVFSKIKKRKLQHLLYRGIDSKKDITGIKKGSTITFNEFLSTSLSESTAYKFQNCGEHPCCIFILKVTDKMPYLPLYKNLQYKNESLKNEHEVLLPRETSWQVIKKYSIPLDLNRAALCSYDDIIKKNNKITVYELSSLHYKPPEKLKLLDYDKYQRSIYAYVSKKNITFIKNNSKFFRIKNSLIL